MQTNWKQIKTVLANAVLVDYDTETPHIPNVNPKGIPGDTILINNKVYTEDYNKSIYWQPTSTGSIIQLNDVNGYIKCYCLYTAGSLSNASENE